MSSPYRSPLHRRKKISIINFIYTLYTSPLKGLGTSTDNLRVLWDSPNTKTWFPGSTKPQKLVPSRQKLCHSFIRWQVPLELKLHHLIQGASKTKQSCATWWILPCRFYQNYLPSSRLVTVKTSSSRKQGFQCTQNTERTLIMTYKPPLPWHCCCSYSGSGTQTYLLLVPLTVMPP